MRRYLVLRHTPPEWNIRVLTEDDFYQYCDEAGIAVSEVPLELPGLYISGDSQPEIFLDDELRGAERLFIAFHELAHAWLHPPDVRMFHGLSEQTEDSKQVEDEADIVAVCCLIPGTMLPHYQPSELVELYGYTPELVRFRREVFDKWGL